jgi:O-antigen ligase
MNTGLTPRLPGGSQLDASSASRGSFLNSTTAGLAVAIGFSIPVSTSLAEIVTTLFLLSWVLQGELRERLRRLADNPLARFALAIFGMLFLAIAWSSASWWEATRCLLKYREFMYVPLLIPVFRQQPGLKNSAMHGFTIGAVAMLLLSYFEWLSGTDVGLASSPNDFVIAKDRIIHSLLMALLVYFSAQQLSQQSAWRWVYAAIIALAAPNILFLVQGRTGYVLLGLLTLLYMSQQFGRRGLVAAAIIVGFCAVGAYSASGTVRARVAQTVLQVKSKLGFSSEKVWDPRLEYYTNTLQLIRRHPVLGTGTGSFSPEYAKLAAAQGQAPTTDPHNEYLHLAVQGGVPTAGLFVAMLLFQWLSAARLPAADGRIARGVVLAIAVGSLFNSLVLSITGGLVWSYFSALSMSDFGCDEATERSALPAAREDASSVVSRAA